MIRLNVPFLEKDEAKELGARWNPTGKFWYCEDDQLDLFAKWYSPALNPSVGGSEPSETQDPSYMTVSEISNMIEECFDNDDRFRMVRVRGEILNLSPWKGYWFFEIKDDKAVISCTIWPNTAEAILDFDLENGQEVGIVGNLQYYGKQGKASLRVARIRDMGEGDYQAKLNLLKDKLQAEGLFSEEHKKPIPKYPRRVGIITSEHADALRDILRIAHDRNPFVQLVLYPVTVQGDTAAASIIRGIKYMDAGGYDVIVVSRGGGSREDLSPFDDEDVVRAVYHANTPIVTGVGHERDVTLIDLVADKRFSTPTYAAQGVLPDVMSDILQLRSLEGSIRTGMNNIIISKKQQLRICRETLERYNPAAVLERNKVRLERAEQNLETNIRRLFDMKKHRYELLVTTLHGLSPTAKLLNGFGYVTHDDKPIMTVDDIKPGQKMMVRIHDGDISATVEEIIRSKSDTEE
ncbi:MAG: exodeoxyribonuclease VII large subunit [Eubacterium sp.]|nr:exodeoxyribonuclease VII large subunit [Eubacterium sp.]